jgi:gliding motility-associated-like protein/uncharacterized repeat protein (TIGR01451 family)
LAKGDSLIRVFKVKVDAVINSNVTSIGNIAYVNDGTRDPDVPTCTTPGGCPADKGDTTKIPLQGNVDLTVKKSVSAVVAGVGDGVTYTIMVMNNGPSTAHHVIITDTLAKVLTYVANTVNKGTVNYSSTNRLLQWNIDSLQIDEQATLTITVNATQDGTVVNTARGTSDEPDVNIADNTSTVSKDILVLKIPNVITPNGDGKNDYFRIPGLELYTENDLVIFNRWNNKVYEKKNYSNEWNGSGLNAGTYFYVLRLKDKNGNWHSYKGYIMLLRN